MRIGAGFVGVVTAAFVAAAGSVVVAQQPNAGGSPERINWSLPATQSKGGWKFGSEYEIPHRYSIEELIHKDDTIDNWRELVTIESFRRPPDATAEDVFNKVRLARENRCPPGIMHWTAIDKSAVSVVFEVIRDQPCRDFAPDRELGRILVGTLDVFYLRFDAKGTAWRPGQREDWLKAISEAKIGNG
jgi:hypothetical protein